MLTLCLHFFNHRTLIPSLKLTHAEAVRLGLATVTFRFSEKRHWRLPHVGQNKRVFAFGGLCLDRGIDNCAAGV